MKLKTTLLGIAVSFVVPVTTNLIHTEGSVVVPDIKMAQVIEIDIQPELALSKRVVSCQDYASIIEKYDWDVAIASAISRAESGCRPDALGDTTLKFIQNGREYGYSVSLFQVRILPGREHCDSFDPEVNIKCAYNIYKARGGWTDWSVFTNGKYLSYLQ